MELACCSGGPHCCHAPAWGLDMPVDFKSFLLLSVPESARAWESPPCPPWRLEGPLRAGPAMQGWWRAAREGGPARGALARRLASVPAPVVLQLARRAGQASTQHRWQQQAAAGPRACAAHALLAGAHALSGSPERLGSLPTNDQGQLHARGPRQTPAADNSSGHCTPGREGHALGPPAIKADLTRLTGCARGIGVR
jgi:hypothetical protein